MTPRLYRKLVGGPAAGASGSGAAVLAAMRGLSTNLQGENYFGGNYTLANVLIGAGTEGFDNGGVYHDADLWLQGVPAGLSTEFVRRIVFATNYLPPGNWIVATRQGMICTAVNQGASSFMHITQQGIDSPTQSLRNATFTIDDLGADGDYSGIILNVTVKAPATGGPFNCKDLYVGLVSDYTSWLGGQISSNAFLTNNANIKSFKDADLNGQNDNRGLSSAKYITQPGQLVSPTRSYQGTAYRSYGTIAQQAKEANAVYWPVLPYVFESYLFSCSVANNSITRGDYSGNIFTTPRSVGDQLVFWGGYFQDGLDHNGVHNVTIYYIVQLLSATEWRVSLTPGGTPVTITSDFAGNDFNAQICYVVDPYPVYLAIAQQIHAVNPTGMVAPQATLEPWNSGYGYETMRQVSCVQAGVLYSAGAGYAYRVLRMWKAFQDAGFSRGQVLYSVESGITDYHFGLLGNDAFDYVSRDPSFHFGKKMSELMDCFSTAIYPHPRDASNNNMGAIECMINGAMTYTPAQWSVIVRRGIDYFKVNNAANLRIAVDAKVPNLPAIMYEGEPSDEGLESQNGGLDFMDKPVTAVVTGTPGSLTAATPFGGAWIPNLPITVLSTGTKPGGLTAQSYYFVHSSSTTTSLVLSATAGGSALAITSAGTGSISVTVKGQQVLDLSASYLAYKNSSQRASDMSYYMDNIVHDTIKARTIAMYSIVCNFNSKSSSSMRWYGQKRSDGIADNPCMTYLKGYTGWVTSP